MLKVVAVVASPRKDGNTEYLAKVALEQAEKRGVETELITLYDKDISYCTGCDKCKQTNKCAISDDMDELTEKIGCADGVIMASPVYFGNMTAQAKTFLDRLRPLRNVHAFKYKVCGAISAGGFRNGGQETTIASIHDAFLIQGAIIVGDNRPTAHYGAAGVGNTGEDEIGVETSRLLADRIVDVLLKLDG
ncbi:MAG: flavodoxin [Methanosphaera sp. rholeuAM74]|nr:MAG: flavodoxin [Methanosphaera sp. rholeuAM74]